MEATEACTGESDETIDVIVVDDDRLLLNSCLHLLERTLLHQHPVRIIKESNPLEALKRVSDARYLAAVVSDYSMEGMNGYELLERVRKIHPGARRILVSGKDDVRAKAITSGVANTFILKAPGFYTRCLAAEVEQAIKAYAFNP